MSLLTQRALAVAGAVLVTALPVGGATHEASAMSPAGTSHAGTRSANEDGFTLATLPYQPAWCAPEMDALTTGVCHIAGTPAPDGRKTLVVFLHGVIAKNTMWQWLQERGIARSAKRLHFEAIVPQAPAVGPGGGGGFAWPGGARRAGEDALLDEWASARRTLEARNGRAFDEVYVVGFSSGAYFATSLALRAKVPVDGYVVLAGGAPGPLDADTRRTPVFVGVCTRDGASAPEARALGRALSVHGWPVRTDEEAVGHEVNDVHMTHALAWLRAGREHEGKAAGEAKAIEPP